MSHLFHRSLAQVPATAVKGEGPWLIDAAGKRYLDASGGAGVSCLGHSHPAVIAAIEAQLRKLPYTHTSFFTSEPAERLADKLVAGAPQGLTSVFFTSGGSEATETALKLARQYHVERGEPQRRRFIARLQSYHGNSLGALSVGGNMARRALYEPILLPNVSHIEPCYAYRNRRPDETEEAYGLRAADALEAEIQRLGPQSVAAFIMEPVVGASLGAAPAVAGYLKRIRAICDRHGVLLILDEVMCGMGRTGHLYACAEDGVVPDLLTTAKGLGAGYQPIGAVLIHERIRQVMAAGSGAFQHGFTYVGHAAACAGALAVQEVFEREGLVERVRVLGRRLRDGLQERFGNHHHVGDIRGRGLFVGLELVEDRASKRPFDPARKVNGRLKATALEEGLLCYPSGGTVDGKAGDHVLLAPPYICSEAEIDLTVERLGKAIDRVLA